MALSNEPTTLTFDHCSDCGKIVNLVPKWAKHIDRCDCLSEEDFDPSVYISFSHEEIALLLQATGPSPLDAMTDEEVMNIGGAAPGTYETMQSARQKLLRSI